MRKKTLALVIGCALAAAMIPSISSASHCDGITLTAGPVFVPSPVANGGSTPYGVGTTAVGTGCEQLQGNDLGLVPNNNFFPPQSTVWRVVITNVPADQAPGTPTVQFNSGTITALSLSYDSKYRVWRAGPTALSSATTKITVRAKLCIDSTGCTTINPTSAARVITRAA